MHIVEPISTHIVLASAHFVSNSSAAPTNLHFITAMDI